LLKLFINKFIFRKKIKLFQKILSFHIFVINLEISNFMMLNQIISDDLKLNLIKEESLQQPQSLLKILDQLFAINFFLTIIYLNLDLKFIIVPIMSPYFITHINEPYFF
jgi:hypothetical protein